VGLPETVIAILERKGRLGVLVSPVISPAADVLGTRCPGPSVSHPLTSASLPLSVLHRPTFTVKLHGGSFSNGPYRVTTHSTLTVTLHREKVTTQILP
jgi:hypothetical protein